MTSKGDVSASARDSSRRHANLGTPCYTNDLGTPVSTSSLKFACQATSSPSDLPQLAARLVISSPRTPLPRASMSRLLPGEETPECGGRGFIVGVQRAFSTSKRMQQVLGFQGPVVPFAPPPNMPEDLSEAYEHGMQEYGTGLEEHDWNLAEEGSVEVDGGDESHYPFHHERANVLSDDFARVPAEPTSSSMETLAYQGEGTHRHARHVRFELGEEQEEFKSDEGAAHIPSNPPDIAYLQEGYDEIAPKNCWFHRTANLFRRSPQQQLPHHTSQITSHGEFDFLSTASLEASLSLHPNPSSSAFFSTLFQGPAALPQIIVTSPAPPSPPNPRKRQNGDFEVYRDSMSSRSSSSLPPSLPAKKKHCGDSIPTPTGLPPLPSSSTWAWEAPFPGNMEGLAYALMTWHTTLLDLYSRVDNASEYMRIHPMFPYPPTKPKHTPLISASFWDTSAGDAKECWFVGPGDVEILSYDEVDTFGERGETEKERMRQSTSFGNMLRTKECKAREMRDRNVTGEGRWCFIVIRGHPDKHQDAEQYTSTTLNDRGGKETGHEKEAAPYVFIAFPSSAVTHSSECLHTLYPDIPEHPPASEELLAPGPALPNRKASTRLTELSRISSLPAPNRALRDRPVNHPQNNLSGKLHSSSKSFTSNSNSKMPPPRQTYNEWKAGKGKPWTLRRTIMQFEKAGNLPLIEGYRTDLSMWRPWLDAVGRGKGKLVLFRERE